MHQDCIFCKIINKEIPAKIEFEDEKCLAFYDIKPQAKTHLLVIPKKHIPSMREVTEQHEDILGHMMKKSSDFAKSLNLEHYRMRINVGEEAGQIIFHLHVHIMSVQ